jgi:hypothetical protein
MNHQRRVDRPALERASHKAMLFAVALILAVLILCAGCAGVAHGGQVMRP